MRVQQLELQVHLSKSVTKPNIRTNDSGMGYMPLIHDLLSIYSRYRLQHEALIKMKQKDMKLLLTIKLSTDLS